MRGWGVVSEASGPKGGRGGDWRFDFSRRDKGSASVTTQTWGGIGARTHRAMTGRPATDLEPSALTARVELLSGERGGDRVSASFGGCGDARGRRGEGERTPGSRVDNSPRRAESRFPVRWDRRGRDRRGAARAERARKRPRGSIRDGDRRPDRVRVSPRGARDAIERSTPALTLRPLFSAKALCCSRWRTEKFNRRRAPETHRRVAEARATTGATAAAETVRAAIITGVVCDQRCASGAGRSR